MTEPVSIEIPALTLPFDAELPMPGSKSHANRALVAACLAEGRSTLIDITPCDDVRLMVDNLVRMGFDIRWHPTRRDVVEVDGGLPIERPAHEVELDCQLAGTTLRFLCAVAAITPGDWVVTGNERMRQRPIRPLVVALDALGVDTTDTRGCPPVTISGGPRSGGKVRLDASLSSQFLSALMLVAPAMEHGLEIELESPPTSPTYLELTRRVLSDFGIQVTGGGQHWRVHPGRLQAPRGDYQIEGDWSAAGAWLALSQLTGSKFRATNLDPESSQGDSQLPEFLSALQSPGERTLDVTAIPDQTMNIAVVAAMREGTTTINGAANLRHKECDRLAVTRTELSKLGVDIEEHDDGLIIRGPTKLGAAALETHGDHRMAMAFAALGSLCGGVQLDDASCVAKSYPGFFADLSAARDRIACVSFVGMRGVGKTSVARAVARQLGLLHIDTDQRFVDRHGIVAEFVEREGWARFREIEAEIVAEATAPGCIVSVGGGALETEQNRRVLRSRSTVIWLREDIETIVERVGRSNRPRLSELPLEDEIRETMERRTPAWSETAHVALPPSGSVAARAASVVSALRHWRT